MGRFSGVVAISVAFAAVLVVMGPLLMGERSPTERVTIDVAPQIAEIRHLNSELAEFNRVHGFPVFPIAMDKLEWKVRQGGKTFPDVYVDFDASDTLIQFAANSRQPFSLQIGEAIDASSPIRSSQAKPPTWPEEKAITIARGWLALVTPEGPEYRFDKGTARFFHQFGNGEGTWEVTFRRVTKEGIAFADDFKRAFISESQGPFFMRLFSADAPFSDVSTTLISQSDAFVKAGPALTAMRRSLIPEGWVQTQPQSGDEPMGQLLVVVPNYLGVSAPSNQQAASRIAWVFSYTFSSVPDSDGMIAGPAPIQVWIDAETGEPLGGFY